MLRYQFTYDDMLCKTKNPNKQTNKQTKTTTKFAALSDLPK